MLYMPNKNSRYRKVLFEEHMPIERTPESRSLTVIVEILDLSGEKRPDPKDFDMINFADSIVRTRIMNEDWAPTGTSVQHLQYDQLPVLGAPAKEEGNLVAWVLEISQ